MKTEKREKILEYGDVDKIEIFTGSSGSFRIVITTKLLNYADFKPILDKLIESIRAPAGVEG